MRSSSVLCLLALALLPSTAWAECVGRGEPHAPIALVFSGGGAKGAWEAGAAAALIEDGVPIALAAGSSAGALNAALVADGRVDRLEAAWRGLTRDDVYAIRPSVALAGLLPGWLGVLAITSRESLLEPSKLRARIETTLDLDRIRASKTRVVVVATDVVARRARIFDNAALTVDALLSSGAVPGLFPAVDVGGERLVDGGIVARAPILEALAHDRPARALVLVSYSLNERGRTPTTVRRSVEESFETAMLHQIHRDVELAQLRHPNVDIQTLSPSSPLDLRPLDFDPASLARTFARGRSDARTCLKTWHAR